VVDSNRIYVLGGEAIGATSACAQYDIGSNSWAPINPLIQARSGFAAGILGGKIYASQGNGATVLPTTEEYPLPKTVYLFEKL
jgi:hypothetical protein